MPAKQAAGAACLRGVGWEMQLLSHFHRREAFYWKLRASSSRLSLQLGRSLSGSGLWRAEDVSEQHSQNPSWRGCGPLRHQHSSWYTTHPLS